MLARQQETRHDHQLRGMLLLGNSLAYAQLAPDALRATEIYRRTAHVISLLTPMDITGAGFVRLGRQHDGGYVMVDAFGPNTIDAAYGFGIATDTSWDAAVAAYGIDVLMFDHTISPLPNVPGCRAFPIGVTGFKKGAKLRTLRELLVEHGHSLSSRLVMKMDIEGAEWDVFDEADSSVIGQFSQIAVEFHRLTDAVHRESNLRKVTRVLTKINRTHQSVHVHGNVLRLPLWVGPLTLPDILEVTFARRSDWDGRWQTCTRQFPTALDQPSDARSPDIFLGTFSVPPGR